MTAVDRAHDRLRASFALVLGPAVVLAGAAGRLIPVGAPGPTPAGARVAGVWPTELVVVAAALLVVSVLALAVVRPRRGQLVSLGAAPLAALLGVAMAAGALFEPAYGPQLWPAAVAAAGGATTLAALARWSLAAGAHLVPRAPLDPAHRYAVTRPAADKTGKEAKADKDGKTRMTAASAIQAGDRVEVPGAQRIPTDGTVVSGEGFADERALTAAELAVAKAPGDVVLAGTTTDAPDLVYIAASPQSDGLLVRLHAHQRALLHAIAHGGDAAGGRVLAHLVTLLALAGGIAVLLLPRAGTTIVQGLPAAAGVLLALNASAPLIAARQALAAAAARAFRRGVVPREAAALVALGRAGRWQADARVLVSGGRLDVLGDAEACLPVIAALLQGSEAESPDVHLLRTEARRRKLAVPLAAAVRRGNGVWHGTVGGARWSFGPRSAIADEARVEVPRDQEASVRFLEERSATTWILARTDDELVAAIGVTVIADPDLVQVAQALRATVLPGPSDALRGAVAAAAHVERDGPPLRARDASLLAPGSLPPSSGLLVEVREPHPAVRFEAPITCFTASAVHLPAIIDDLRAARSRARRAAALAVILPPLVIAPLLAWGALDPVLGTLAGVVSAVIAARASASPPARPS